MKNFRLYRMPSDWIGDRWVLKLPGVTIHCKDLKSVLKNLYWELKNWNK